jgi:hypothetical protein
MESPALPLLLHPHTSAKKTRNENIHTFFITRLLSNPATTPQKGLAKSETSMCVGVRGQEEEPPATIRAAIDAAIAVLFLPPERRDNTLTAHGRQ